MYWANTLSARGYSVSCASAGRSSGTVARKIQVFTTRATTSQIRA